MTKLAAALLLVTLYLPALAQRPSPPAKSDDTKTAPAANPTDVDSIDHIVAALYDVISGPAGQKRDWNRFRSLFIDGARLIPTGCRATGTCGTRVLTPEDYVTSSAPFLENNGFFESEIARRSDQFGRIAQLFSTYESRHKKGEEPFARGINGIQLVNDGTRWWIATVFWQSETKDSPLPDKYLKSE